MGGWFFSDSQICPTCPRLSTRGPLSGDARSHTGRTNSSGERLAYQRYMSQPRKENCPVVVQPMGGPKSSIPMCCTEAVVINPHDWESPTDDALLFCARTTFDTAIIKSGSIWSPITWPATASDLQPLAKQTHGGQSKWESDPRL